MIKVKHLQKCKCFFILLSYDYKMNNNIKKYSNMQVFDINLRIN